MSLKRSKIKKKTEKLLYKFYDIIPRYVGTIFELPHPAPPWHLVSYYFEEHMRLMNGEIYSRKL
jgi:hypothetical protein